MKRLPLAALLLAATAAPAVIAQPAAQHSAAAAGSSIGVDLSGIKQDARPGDSFDIYANGAWRDRTEIPADRTALGAFQTVQEVVDRRNAEIIAGAASANPAAGTNERRIADYYAAYLNRPAIDGRGTAPLRPVLQRIQAIANRRDIRYDGRAAANN